MGSGGSVKWRSSGWVLWFWGVVQMMVDYLHRHMRSYVIRILRCGRIPRHVAFIMDGNRRYAMRRHLERTAGHYYGFRKLEQTLEWCFELGVQAVTIYAFSIENFKRPVEEVSILMQLAVKKFEEFSQNSELITKYQVCIRVVGQLDLLPIEVRHAAYNIMYATRHHSRYVLNICFPYTSRAEILEACNEAVRGVREGKLKSDDLTAELLDLLMGTQPSPPIDLLIRTSGEWRLSEFLLWQTTDPNHPTTFAFLDALWPEFGLGHFSSILLRYQCSSASHLSHPPQQHSRIEDFLIERQGKFQRKIAAEQTIDPLEKYPTPPSSPQNAPLPPIASKKGRN